MNIRLIPPALSCALIAVLSGCPKEIPQEKPPENNGPEVIACAAPEDCPDTQPTCRFGVCARECQSDAACDVLPGTYCSAQRICEPGCRTSAECEAGKVCTLGSCTEGAACGSKCDCQTGQVCNGGRCEGPPDTCTGIEDCPRGPTTPDTCEPYRCDGFSNTCLYNGEPPPCGDADDCFGRLGCEGGCLCTPNGTCVPDAACTVATERDDCGVGFYCDNDLRCAATPVCTDDSQCVPYGLTCDEVNTKCVRPQECTTSADCAGLAPTTFCDTRTNPGYCQVPNCINTGTTCTSPQVCSADGRCVTPGTGGPCINDSACPSDQYCAFVNGTGACAVGCRNNGSCGTNQQCNAEHTCVASGSLQPLNGPCADPSDCQSGLTCYNGSCAEACEGFDVGPCAGQSGCCALSAKACCNLVSVCSDGFFGQCLQP